LADTNVITELSRKQPNAGVLEWFSLQKSLSFSVITLEEIGYGIERIPADQNARLKLWLGSLLSIPPEILVVDSKVAQVAGQLRASRERAGRPVTQADMLIAATALTCGRTLVTRNTKDFSDCGVALLNPFS